MNTREITLSANGVSFTLGVNPAEFRVEMPQEMNTYNLQGGEYAEPGEAGLRRMSIETFLPAGNSQWAMSVGQAEAMRSLEKWKTEKTGVQVTVSGMMSMTAYISDLTYTLREGDEDVHFTASFIEQKILVAKEIPAPTVTPAPSLEFRPTETPATYTIVKGDTLSKIGKKYGVPWREIYDANKTPKGELGNNPNLIFPGQKIVIPK